MSVLRGAKVQFTAPGGAAVDQLQRGDDGSQVQT